MNMTENDGDVTNEYGILEGIITIWCFIHEIENILYVPQELQAKSSYHT